MTGNDLIDLRFGRAKYHINALVSELREFIKGKPYSLITEPNADRSEYVFRFRVREYPPAGLAPIASDAIHNLRATLDNIAFILAGSPKTRKRAERIQFPIIHPGRKGGRAAFNRWVKDRLKGVKPQPLAIIESVQPYHGLRRPTPTFKPWPPYPLTVLNQLSNVDKHRTLHLLYMSASAFKAYTSADPIRHQIFAGPLKDNAVVAHYWFDQPNVDVKRPAMQVQLAVEIPNSKKGPLPLIEYLGGIMGLIGNDLIQPLRPYLDRPARH